MTAINTEHAAILGIRIAQRYPKRVRSVANLVGYAPILMRKQGAVIAINPESATQWVVVFEDESVLANSGEPMQGETVVSIADYSHQIHLHSGQNSKNILSVIDRHPDLRK